MKDQIASYNAYVSATPNTPGSDRLDYDVHRIVGGLAEHSCGRTVFRLAGIDEANGVQISFVVHRYGDGRNAGVVVTLVNNTDGRRNYRFRVIFRSANIERVADPVTGSLDPREVKTGERSGLWWIPLKDGSLVTEVGLNGRRIEHDTHHKK